MTVRTALMAATLIAITVGEAPLLAGTPTSAAGAQPAPGRSLGLVSAPNLRDIGGYATGSGAVVRTGLVYRSDQLNSTFARPTSKPPIPTSCLQTSATSG